MYVHILLYLWKVVVYIQCMASNAILIHINPTIISVICHLLALSACVVRGMVVVLRASMCGCVCYHTSCSVSIDCSVTT